MFRGNSSPWRAQLEKTVTLIVTFELESKRANHETNKRTKKQKKSIPGRGNTIYKDPEEGNKTVVIGVPELGETECNTLREVSRSQIRKGFLNHERECKFPFKKNRTRGTWMAQWLSISLLLGS